MQQIVNNEYKPMFLKHNKRYVILMGGRGGGRSTVASQFATAKLTAPEYFRCAIMRLVLGDIRNSIYKEITDRMEETEIENSLDIADNSMTIKYGSNSINAVGFRKSSGDQKSKLKSLASYNCIIIEEADEIPEDDFMQLDDSLRTIKGDITIILLLNPPPKTHWIIKRWFNLTPVKGIKDFYIPHLKDSITNTIFIKTSFEDNTKNMSQDSIDNYREYETTKPNYFYNTIAGYVPETVRGRIYNDWKEIPDVPHEAELVRRGLDFGYTNDPTALLDIYKYDGGYIFDERLYKTGLLNKHTASFILSLEDPNTLVIGDSAEPKSIADLDDLGVTILGAKKQKQDEEGGKISYLNWSIGKMQGVKISYTARSKNIKEEQENYAWMEDKEGNGLNIPMDKFNHLMDAGRYGLMSILSEKPVDTEAVKRVAQTRHDRVTQNDTGA